MTVLDKLILSVGIVLFVAFFFSIAADQPLKVVTWIFGALCAVGCAGIIRLIWGTV